HVNNYIVNYFGIALAYGQFSGWRTTYVPGINGARIVQLTEGKREFDTWIRLLDGSVEYNVTFPAGLKGE
ncbi:MAG TPA: metallophosphatase, partial [Porphyromonadaceae bacterium]|nr:metallophosphatase [Porphyromonadaceae bacterium]